MITDADIKKLSDYLILVFKDSFVTKDEFNLKVDKLQTSVDLFAKDYKTNSEEIIVVGHKVNNLEQWAHKIARKTNVKFEQ